MKPNVQCWYLAQFFLPSVIFQRKVVEKIKGKCSVPEKTNTHFIFKKNPPKIVTFMTKNEKKYCSARQPTDDSMTHIACWIPKATNTHPEYVIIIDFPPQRWLNERGAIVNKTSIACLVFVSLKYILQTLMTANLTLCIPNFKPYVFVIYRLSQYTITLCLNLKILS